MLTNKVKFILTSITFLLFYFIFNQFSSWYENKLKNEENKAILSELKAHSNSIKESINKRFIILKLLKSYVSQNIDSQNKFDLNNIELNNYAKTLFNSVEGIRALQVSPNGIHKFVYPLIGNEKSFNKNLFLDKRVEVLKMLEITKNSESIITNAPYPLIQGGFGLVARQSIKQNGEFWGFVVMVLDMSYILDKAGFEKKQYGLDILISQGKKNIYGNKDILNSSHQSIPLSIANQKLTISAYKKESLYSTTIFYIDILILLISVLFAFVIYTLIDKAKKHDEILTSVFNVLPDLFFIMKKDGEIIDYRAQSDSNLYVGPEVFLNKKMQDILPENVGKIYNENIHELSNNSNLINFKYELELGDETKHFEARMIKLPNDEHIMAIVRDITENEKMIEMNRNKEKIMHKQNKMVAIGEMLENIAHQWRQPLSVISISATGCKMQKEMNTLTDKELISYLNAINDSAQFLSQTIDEFKNFINPNGNIPSAILLSDTIEKTLKLVSSQFTTMKIKIIKNIENVSIVTLENELIQILINLLNNSKDALVDQIIEHKLIFINVYENDNSLIIEIKDNAGGIKEDIIDRVFEPYFTTKHKYQGTGIGLYMTEEIIRKQMNGNIEVTNKDFVYENILYVGAEFRITLPLG